MLLCVCVFCFLLLLFLFSFFFFFLIDFLCKQAVCHFAEVFTCARSRETSVKNRFHSLQSTQYSLKQTVLQRNQKQVLLRKEYAANSQWKHRFYCIFLVLNAAKMIRIVPSFPCGISPPKESPGNLRASLFPTPCTFLKCSIV